MGESPQFPPTGVLSPLTVLPLSPPPAATARRLLAKLCLVREEIVLLMMEALAVEEGTAGAVAVRSPPTAAGRDAALQPFAAMGGVPQGALSFLTEIMQENAPEQRCAPAPASGLLRGSQSRIPLMRSRPRVQGGSGAGLPP